ncbi:protein GVQW3-like [Hermetia illucens]|uniref:protein GVQW3-like n=1 Tax=Hermetia illucens TaxID=343691 RepID=UPI0018CC64AE|nr:protein GVQW3-like [Hermetia illucens]
MLTVAYSGSALSTKDVYKWYKLFQNGREDVSDELRSGHPSTSTIDVNVEAAKKIVLKNRQITIREVAEDAGISVLKVMRRLRETTRKKTSGIVEKQFMTFASQ